MNLRLFKTDPEGEGAEEDVALRQGVERIHHLAVKELKVRGGGHVHPGGAADQVIEAVGGKLVKGRLLAAILLDALDDLVPLLPKTIHLDDLLRRVLEIAVDDHHAVALCLLEPREHRGLLAEVAAEADADHVRIGRAAAQDFAPGAVAGAVVDKQKLIVDPGVSEDYAEAFGRDGDHFFFIVRGENNREQSKPSLSGNQIRGGKAGGEKRLGLFVIGLIRDAFDQRVRVVAA